jgi:hypothetical protein
MCILPDILGVFRDRVAESPLRKARGLPRHDD